MISTRPEAVAIAREHGFTGNGQSLYDWSKSGSEAAIAKLAEFGLAPARDGEKVAWVVL